jgi:hypothetical protein
MPPASSPSIAIRVKRGLVDPNSPGGLTKDHGYLTGLELVEELATDPAKVRLLYATKWPVDMLAVAEDLAQVGALRFPSLAPCTVLLGVFPGVRTRCLWDSD